MTTAGSLIFFSGSLFTSAERLWNAQLVKILRSNGLNIWLAQENVPSLTTATEIFEICKKGIDQSDIVLAIMDGSDPESGTCFECGYAYGRGKPVYTIRTDSRKSGDLFDSRFNLMLTESSTVIEVPEVSTVEEVAEAVFRSIKK